uniref:Uncharacterized protein n=1 Tax=Plectus sambesii TaxID=2011161 RepID=A0A914V0R2_9BILA
MTSILLLRTPARRDGRANSVVRRVSTGRLPQRRQPLSVGPVSHQLSSAFCSADSQSDSTVDPTADETESAGRPRFAQRSQECVAFGKRTTGLLHVCALASNRILRTALTALNTRPGRRSSSSPLSELTKQIALRSHS